MAFPLVEDHSHSHEVRVDPAPIVAGFTARQRRVYNAAKWGSTEEDEWARIIFAAGLESVRLAIMAEVARWGGNPEEVELGPMTEAIVEEEAEASAESIVNTYNHDLARAINSIGEEAEGAGPDGEDLEEPTVSEYKRRLFGNSRFALFVGAAWFAVRSAWKKVQIAMTEAAKSINLGINLFYRNSPEIDPMAFLVPFDAVCPICIAGVEGNPWPSMSELIAAGPWPAHNNCVHFPAPADEAEPVDADWIWTGEDWE